MVRCVLEQDFIDAQFRMSRSVDTHLRMDAAKLLLFWKFDIETDAPSVPSDETALEPNTRVIERRALVENGRTDAEVAEAVGRSVEQLVVGRRHDQPEIVRYGVVRHHVVDRDERSRFWTCGGKQASRPIPVRGFNIELNGPLGLSGMIP